MIGPVMRAALAALFVALLAQVSPVCAQAIQRDILLAVVDALRPRHGAEWPQAMAPEARRWW